MKFFKKSEPSDKPANIRNFLKNLNQRTAWKYLNFFEKSEPYDNLKIFENFLKELLSKYFYFKWNKTYNNLHYLNSIRTDIFYYKQIKQYRTFTAWCCSIFPCMQNKFHFVRGETIFFGKKELFIIKNLKTSKTSSNGEKEPWIDLFWLKALPGLKHYRNQLETEQKLIKE